MYEYSRAARRERDVDKETCQNVRCLEKTNAAVTLPPPRFKQWDISRSTNFTGLKSVSLDKNLSKNLNCFAAKRQKFSGFPKSPTHRTKNAPKSTFCVCHNKNSKRRTRFEKLHRRAFTRKRKKKRSREDKKPRAGDNTKAICTFPPTPRARVLFCPFGFFGFLSVARGV